MVLQKLTMNILAIVTGKLLSTIHGDDASLAKKLPAEKERR